MTDRAELLIGSHDNLKDMVRHAWLMSKVESRYEWILATDEVREFSRESLSTSPCWTATSRDKSREPIPEYRRHTNYPTKQHLNGKL